MTKGVKSTAARAPRAAVGSRRARTGVAVLVAVALAAGATAGPATATTVELRVEAAGAPAPLFAGPVSTSPHPVDGGDGTGPHTCAGPVGGAPSATATGALDDAMRAAGIPWRGNWDPSFRDFFVERIGAYASQAPDDYWSLTVDGRYSSGGCQAALAEGDEVRFFYGPLFGEQPGVEGAPGESGGGPTTVPGAGPPPTAPTPAPIPAAQPGRLAARAALYLRHHRETAGDPWSRLALALRRPPRADAEPVALAAAELLDGPLEPAAPRIGVARATSILGALRGDGSLREDADSTALAVIALGGTAPRAAARAASRLVRAQAPSGGFGFRRGVPPDVDTTGLAAWALAREGRRAPARRAALFVASAQSADGGFPSTAGGESNAQSTGLALVALRAGGLGAGHASGFGASGLTYLAGLARPDGSIPYATAADPTPVWSTAQALLGLVPRSDLLRR